VFGAARADSAFVQQDGHDRQSARDQPAERAFVLPRGLAALL